MKRWSNVTVALCVCLVSACNGDSGQVQRWHSLAENLEGALFSVSGTSADNVWIAGADQHDGNGPTVLHWNGAQWGRLATGLDSGDLLWVLVFEAGPMFFTGSGGRILKSCLKVFKPTVHARIGTTPQEGCILFTHKYLRCLCLADLKRLSAGFRVSHYCRYCRS